MTGAALQIPIIGMEATQFIYWLLAAFAGGAFGAAIGALPAFCFTGFAVIAGEAANAIGLSGAGSGVELGASGLTGLVGFGPVFGPHIAFAGGAAAAAYAAKKEGAMPPQEDGGYHPGKDIAYALGTRPDVLAVGGVFGIFGALSNNVLATFSPVAFDTRKRRLRREDGTSANSRTGFRDVISCRKTGTTCSFSTAVGTIHSRNTIHSASQ